ncbi:unnamed protein product [Symbiodinium sp. CCMP2592]|nr:unnamed protein product [Symbiodinium sp. CCMP2592]
MQQLPFSMVVLASTFLVCAGTTVHVSAAGEASSVPARGQTADVEHGSSGGGSMVRREEGPKQEMISTDEEFIPKHVFGGCLKNDLGPNRMSGHTGGWKTPDECREFAKAQGKDFFGLEWPQGSPAAGKGQCMAIEDSHSTIQKLGLTEPSECTFHGAKLGGPHRLAFYVILALNR